MLFNSIDFGFFFIFVFTIYWLILRNNFRFQNLFLLLSSYYFYATWDWRFLSLIILSTIVDFTIGLKLDSSTSKLYRKILLGISLTVNLGILILFKYLNFFIDNLNGLFLFFGNEINIQTLAVILPVGISFYTFQTLSYTFDVYNKKLASNKDFISFSAYVAFFPQLVAGPIERASNFLPQFNTKRKFIYSEASQGIRQILWGLFKKVVVADNCAIYADLFFNQTNDYYGSALVLGALFFTFQIYGDFSGYSDIAIGSAKLLGFNLMTNFLYPYFSRDIAEFWRRWHISLSTWFRDYLYIPLGGSKGGIFFKIRNTFIIFLVSGFWHGANWTFIFWGLLNAIYFLPLLLRSKNRQNIDIVAKGRHIPSIKELYGIFSTFILTMFAWIFFRSENLSHAFNFIYRIFAKDLFTIPSFKGDINAFITLLFILMLIIMEWIGRENNFALSKISEKKYIRYAVYYMILILIILYPGGKQDFIYFQF